VTPPGETLADGPDRPIDQAIVDEAVAWFATLASGEASEEAHEALTRWRALHPDHERAWRRLQGLQQEVMSGGVADDPTMVRQVVEDVARQRAARRRLLKSFGGLAALGGGAALVVSTQPTWQGVFAQHRTATGERRALLLSDGSRLLLNTATALSTRFDEHQRLVRLHEGEVRVITAADPQRRPLRVETADGVIAPVGTAFIVRRYPDDVRTAVRVQSGEVHLRPAAAGLEMPSVRAGQQSTFTSLAADRPEVLDVAATTWVDGILSAERMRLGVFLDTLARHRSGWLRHDPAVADLRITGSFPLDDTDRVLDAVARSLPVEVIRLTRYWVTVKPR
jgi:transmembrane sensor